MSETTPERRCLFCLHEFTGRKRRFCYDCLPEHGVVGSHAYMVKYNLLMGACGLMATPWSPASKLELPPINNRPQLSEVRAVCPCGTQTSQPYAMYCSAKCRARHHRRAVRAKRADQAIREVAPPAQSIQRPSAKVSRLERRIRAVNEVRELCIDLPPTGKVCQCGADVEPYWLVRKGLKRRLRCYSCYLDNQSRTTRATHKPTGRLIKCRTCQSEFRRDLRRKLYCSDTCAGMGLRTRNQRKSTKRRTASTGDPYSIQDLIDRDGLDCHLCGKPINPELSGLHPRGINVDHLVPLCAGGLDCRTNVALAHRACNVSRGAGGYAQLKLIA